MLVLVDSSREIFLFLDFLAVHVHVSVPVPAPNAGSAPSWAKQAAYGSL